jgi:hypothetical protein
MRGFFATLGMTSKGKEHSKSNYGDSDPSDQNDASMGSGGMTSRKRCAEERSNDED